MHRICGFVLLVAGLGFILLNTYLLYSRSLWNLKGYVLFAGAGAFGYLLVISGYRMYKGARL